MTTIGCIRAQMGTTPYYIAKMSAGELVDSVGIAKEMPEWPHMNADEKMQREFDIRRVVEEMVPYLVDDPDRFFGSLIIDIYKGFEDIEYESVATAIPSLPAAYRVPMRDMGFLTLPGKERLIALDGQHRLLALKIAIKGIMGVPAGVKLTSAFNNLQPHMNLANEEISVIFVEHTDTQKIRKIFNKINKYAKQTSRGDNIITSDDDIYAVISRRLITMGEPLGPINGIDLVNWKSNTLSTRSKQLTTLSALYTISATLLKDDKYSTMVLPDDNEVDDAYTKVTNFWTGLLNGLSVYQQYIQLTNEDKPVSDLRDDNLLLKPVTQMALAHVANVTRQKKQEWTDVVQRLNKINWSMDNEVWYNILVIPATKKKVITGKEAIRAAGLVIAYMVLGDAMSAAEVSEVREIVMNATNGEGDLPEIIH